MIRLHPNVATTPRTRKLIQQATGNNREIARQFGVSDQTVRRWRQRQD
ncbi:MAG: helix-turn-helix domain-containing protein, partial [Puniceicoccaceae bacterium]